MKKFAAFLFAFLMVLGCVACGGKNDTTPTPTTAPTATPTTAPTEAPAVTQTPDMEIDPGMSVTPEAPKVMTYAEYSAAAIDDEVVIEAYVQAKQSWWKDTATVYLQDENGAYFAYNMACSEADYAKLTQGTKIRVKGYKAAWSGEVEIVDATFEILEGNFVATATDVTALLGTDALIEKQNMFVAFKGMTVESAAIYKWDGSGQDGDDLYFNVSKDGKTYSFTVESYLCDKSTEVYQAVKNLKVGDVVDMEGFLYWYEGVNPHITSVTVTSAAEDGNKTAGVMSYAEYAAAAIDTEVVIEAYVQGKQSWWQDKATVYLQDEDGAYFCYNMACSEADFAKLTQGTKIRVTGYKAEWSGEVEIVDATFEILEGNFVATATDVTDILANEAELIKKQNMFVAFKGMTVESAAIYKWDGSGQDGDDLYFNVSKDGKTYSFTVESYLCDKSTEVYQAVKNLKVGDVVDLEGFLYWYEGVNPHITSVAPASTTTADVKSEGVMTYAEYAAAEMDAEVVIEAYVQGKQSWWDNKVTAYLQDADGAYFCYEMACTEEDFAKLAVGTKIRVTGYKGQWAGEVEIMDATFEILEGNYVAEATDVTALLGTDALIEKQNMFVAFKGMTVESAAIYKWDGSGQDGDDLYFNVSVNGATYTFTVESYLCGKDTEVYQTVKNLKVGDVVDLEGFLYWYEGVNPHITGATVK